MLAYRAWPRAGADITFAVVHGLGEHAGRYGRFANGMAMHGHTLIWYAEDGDAFQALAGKPDAFLNFYVDYIHKVVGRYAGTRLGRDGQGN